jgi:hypothetical protein
VPPLQKQKILDQPYEANPRPDDDFLAIDSTDLGTRKTLVADLIQGALPPGNVVGDIPVWDGDEWLPQQPPGPEPPAPVLSVFTISPTSVQGGANATGTVQVTSAAPAGGVIINLTSNAAEAIVPPTVTIAQGATVAAFTINTTSVGANKTATITATYGATNLQAALGITAQIVTKTIYWGRSNSPRLTTGTEVQALGSTRQDADYRGNAAFTSVGTPNYCFVAQPQSYGGPTAPNGFMIDTFPASMADSTIDNYGTTALNGYSADEISVGGETYLVYRLYNQTAGSFTLIAN